MSCLTLCALSLALFGCFSCQFYMWCYIASGLLFPFGLIQIEITLNYKYPTTKHARGMSSGRSAKFFKLQWERVPAHQVLCAVSLLSHIFTPSDHIKNIKIQRGGIHDSLLKFLRKRFQFANSRYSWDSSQVLKTHDRFPLQSTWASLNDRTTKHVYIQYA